MKTVLTIAGSDCAGGAGIQADLKTIAAHKLYGMSAITSLTAQNTTGVYGIYDVSPEFLKNQLDCIFTDIFPNAVKIGMVSNSGLIQVIADTLKQYRPGRVVLDPVMVSTSGSRLIAPEAQETLVTQLMPLASVITPNIPEAEVLCGRKIENAQDMEAAAKAIYDKIGTDTAVLVKGGHERNTANDCLYTKEGRSGLKESVWKMTIPMAQAVRCLRQSHVIWQWDTPCRRAWKMQNVTLQVHCRRA